MKHHMLSDEVADRFKHWVTWRIVAELMRRHKATRDLRVFELHPAGGMGDTLALKEKVSGGAEFRDLNDFRGWRRMGESPSGPFGTLEADGGYVWPWLTAADPRQVVDDVERLLGLPPPAGGLPASSPTVKTFMMMADILGLACQGRASLQWRAAVYDSSGLDELVLRPSFRDLPHLVSRLPSGPLRESGQRFWLLLPGAGSEGSRPEKPLIVVDLAGTAWFGPNATESVSIPDLIHHHGSSLSAAGVLWHGTGCAHLVP